MDNMDCPICASAKGLKDRQELVQHMEMHRDNPDLMIEKMRIIYQPMKAHDSCNEGTVVGQGYIMNLKDD
jgi:hypothetical protein